MSAWRPPPDFFKIAIVIEIKNSKKIKIIFKDGDEAIVDYRKLLPKAMRDYRLFTSRPIVIEGGLALRILDITVSAEHTRRVTNKKYREFIALEKTNRALCIGQRLKFLRESQNVTQRELGKKINISPSRICLIEKGVFRESSPRIFQILQALGFSNVGLTTLD